MPLYALLNNADNSLVRIENQPPGWLPENAVGFGQEHETRWVPVEYAGEPAYNAATHYLRRLDPVLEDGKWRYKWEVVENPVPAEVSLSSFRIAVRKAGLFDAVEAAIASLTGDDKIEAEEKWNRANVIRRDHPMLSQLAAGLNLTNEQVDAIFRQAALIA